MKTASRAQPRSSPPLVQMRRYTPGVYPFLFPSIISSLPQLPPPSPQRLQIQQPSSSGSTPSPVGEKVDRQPVANAKTKLFQFCVYGVDCPPCRHSACPLCIAQGHSCEPKGRLTVFYWVVALLNLPTEEKKLFE